MNNTYVIDTTSLISYFNEIFAVNCAISEASIDIIRKGFNGENKLIIPSIIFVEIFCKWFITPEMTERIRKEVFLNIKDREKIHICPIEFEVLQNVAIITGIKSKIKFDNHDKQVLATAMMYDSPLITSDTKITKFVKKYKIIPEVLN